MMRALVFLWVSLLLLSSCSLVSVDNNTRYSDASGYFDPHLLDQIQPDETTRDWLRQHFGEPLFVDRDFSNPMVANQAVQIETWQFVRHQQKNTRVFLLFSSRKRHEDSEYLHVVLADDRVVKAWRDTFETVDARRVMGALGYTPVNSKAAPTEVVESSEKPLPGQSGEAVPSAETLEVKDLEVEQVKDPSEDPASASPTADFPSLGPPNLGYTR